VNETNPRLTARILWYAFVLGVVFYYLLAYILRHTGHLLELSLPENYRVPVFVAALFFSFALLLVLLGVKGKRDALLGQDKPAEYLRNSLMMFALSEVPAVLGLALFLAWQNLQWMLVLTVFALIGLFISRPE